jgi:hypothetical protein
MGSIMTVERRITAAAAAVAVGLVTGIVAIVVWVIPDRRDEIWVDLAGAGIQLIVIIGLGGVVTSVLRYAEASRDRRRQRDDRRFAIFAELVTAYHRLKFVRRNLRMIGIRSRPDVLRAEQVEALRTGMQTITEVQLTLEEVVRSLDARSVFDNAAAIHDDLSKLAAYVDGLVDEWEHHGECFWAESQTRKVADLPRLQAFLGPAKDDFRPNAAVPLGRVEWTVRGELPEGADADRRAAQRRAIPGDRAEPGPAPDPFALNP